MFKEGEVRVLLASDVAARGIDIQKVSHVIHFGDVKNEDIYIHRSGRSGRMNEKGVSIYRQKVHRIEADKKISVVIPNYNYEHTVDKCLKSFPVIMFR